jgi:hypothetical protein
MPYLNADISDETELYRYHTSVEVLEENSVEEDPISSLTKGHVEIIQLLREMQRENCAHHAIAATKVDVEEGNKSIIQNLTETNRELTNAIIALKEHIDKFSARRVLIVFSLLMITLNAVVLATVLFAGPMQIRSPLPEFAMIVSIAMFFLAKALPTRKT